MPTRFIIPAVVVRSLREPGGGPGEQFKGAAVVQLYRQGLLSHGQPAKGLGLSRIETDCGPYAARRGRGPPDA